MFSVLIYCFLLNSVIIFIIALLHVTQFVFKVNFIIIILKESYFYILGTFWMYACVSLIGLIILALILPETRGLNLEEVEGLFASSMLWRPKSDLAVKGQAKTVQYVHIRGLNRDGDESELESPE